MTISFIRATIIYVFVIVAVRIMGKRQIGELKPHELVITILVSQIATIPIEDNSLPLLNSLIPLMALIAFELFASILSMKSLWFRNLLQGKPIIVISDGKIDQKQLKRLRFTVDDLIDALRQKDVFDVNSVAYAIIETDGGISVMLKESSRGVTTQDLNLKVKKATMPIIVAIDGKPISEYFGDFKLNPKQVETDLKNKDTDIHDVFLMSRDSQGMVEIIKKDE